MVIPPYLNLINFFVQVTALRYCQMTLFLYGETLIWISLYVHFPSFYMWFSQSHQNFLENIVKFCVNFSWHLLLIYTYICSTLASHPWVRGNVTSKYLSPFLHIYGGNYGPILFLMTHKLKKNLILFIWDTQILEICAVLQFFVNSVLKVTINIQCCAWEVTQLYSAWRLIIT